MEGGGEGGGGVTTELCLHRSYLPGRGCCKQTPSPSGYSTACMRGGANLTSHTLHIIRVWLARLRTVWQLIYPQGIYMYVYTKNYRPIYSITSVHISNVECVPRTPP